jgi:flagellar motor switch protein FliN/FliY
VEALLTVALDEPLNADVYQIIPIVNATEMIAGSKHESSTGEIASVPGAAKKGSQESMIARQPDEKKITVQPVQFMSLDVGATKKEGGVNKMELIYDVGLQLTVELGRTEKTLKEVLEIGPGSVVGLDRLAGEPLDILVNGKLLARGEVIVIDENYGVRIKEIINSGERIGNLKT